MTATSEADPAAQMTSTKPFSGKPLWHSGLIITAVGLIAYCNSLKGAFLLDDRDEILNNVHIRSLMHPWDAMFSAQEVSRPFVGLSLAINYAISGTEVWSYHAVNILIHLLAGLVLLGVVRRTLLSERLRETWGDKADGLALAGAVIWIAHPLCTQAVNYTIQRAESMMGLFYLLTLYCAIRSADSARRALWYGGAVGACVAGMLSKQVMLTAPLVVIVWDYLFLCGPASVTIRKRQPLYALLILSWAVLAGVVVAMPSSQSAGFGIAKFTPIQYLATQFGVVTHYLMLSLWPRSLCFDYGWPKPAGVSQILPGVLIVGSLLIATLWGLARRRPLSFLGAWFFLILSVTSSFMPLDDAAFEFRMYLPLAAVVALVVLAADVVIDRFGLSLLGSRQAATVKMILVVVLVSILAALTLRRNNDYESDLVMWSDVVSKRPENDRAHADLAFALASMNRHDEALQHLEIACNLNPENAATQASLGLGLFLHGDVNRAYRHLADAVRLRPDSPGTHYNLGRALLVMGRPSDAADQFADALKINPDYAQAHLGLGRALERQGRLAESVDSYRLALKLNPDWPEVLCQLALTLVTSEDSKVRDPAEAIRLAQRAAGLSEGQNPGALDILAAVYAEADRFDDARREALKAIDLLRDGGPSTPETQNLVKRVAEYEKGQKPRPPTAIAWR